MNSIEGFGERKRDLTQTVEIPHMQGSGYNPTAICQSHLRAERRQKVKRSAPNAGRNCDLEHPVSDFLIPLKMTTFQSLKTTRTARQRSHLPKDSASFQFDPDPSEPDRPPPEVTIDASHFELYDLPSHLEVRHTASRRRGLFASTSLKAGE